MRQFVIVNGRVCKFGVLFVGVLIIRALPLGVHTRAPDFGDSQMAWNTQDAASKHGFKHSHTRAPQPSRVPCLYRRMFRDL